MKKKKNKLSYKNIKKNKEIIQTFNLNKLNEMKNSIQKNSLKVPLYNIFFDKRIKYNTNSFYDMTIYKVDNIDTNKYEFKNDIEKSINKKNNKELVCKKVILLPNDKQKETLLNMMEGFRKVYNLTLKFIKKRHYIKNKSINKENIKIKKNNIKKENLKEEKTDEEKTDEEKRKEHEEKQRKRLEKINNYKNNNELILEHDIIRTYFLKDELKYISSKYKTTIHTLDYAIKLACASYKSALTNYKNKNIKHFNIRYIKSTKKSLIMDIEKGAFKYNSFFITHLGKDIKTKILDTGNFFDFNVNHDCKLHYNKNSKVFTLLIPDTYIESKDYKLKIFNELKNKKIDNIKKHRILKEPIKDLEITKEDYIIIDPGIRTFLNCFSNSEYIEIGNELREKYFKLFNKIDNLFCKKSKKSFIKRKNKKKIYNIKNKFYKKINFINKNKLLSNEKKRILKKELINKLKFKIQSKTYNKIKNITTDLHWKIIKYLTTHYKHITIGKWSTKSIINNENSILTKKNKRFAQNISFYTFLERLKFKCKMRNISLKIQDERYTSKVCTRCTYKHDKLGGNNIFDCPSCNLCIKRDYNGARNIMLKSIL